MKVGIVYDPIYLEHETGSHPENSQRLVAIMQLLEESGLSQKLIHIPPRMATIKELLAAHSRGMIDNVEFYSQRGGGWLDGDTPSSPASYTAALYAAGGLLQATDAVLSGETNSAFALVRPPGHHATYDRSMGFCLFNNVAVAARYAEQKHGLERILIVDFDVHHGNGTQDVFYEDPSVMYFSTHQYPHYPGTGDFDEIGSGAARGNTINMPFPSGCGDDEYHRAYYEILAPVARRFRPQIIFVSAGYDTHWADDLAGMKVSVSGFADIVTLIKGLANDLCEGRMVFTLEGGYNLQALAYSVKATFDVLLGNSKIDDPMGQPGNRGWKPAVESILEQVKKVHQLV
ncbi:MAG: histone deacetylase [Dehalococcoidia bacterium]|nr:histone deacetylase [Dehalococcoidia bacterium]